MHYQLILYIHRYYLYFKTSLKMLTLRIKVHWTHQKLRDWNCKFNPKFKHQSPKPPLLEATQFSNSFSISLFFILFLCPSLFKPHCSAHNNNNPCYLASSSSSQSSAFHGGGGTIWENKQRRSCQVYMVKTWLTHLLESLPLHIYGPIQMLKGI